jgi:hypothetical protein
MMDRSFDGGETFGEDVEVSNYPWDNYGTFPFICTDYSDRETRGNIYLVWADNRYDDDDIWFQRSDDGGDTWLPFPIRVNDITTYDQFWPVVRCDTNGRVHVIYYDDRDFPGIYNAWLAWSDDAGDTWTNAPLSDQALYFNMPNSNVRFGDYIGLDAYANKIVPVWTDDRTGDFNQEIYSAQVDITTMVNDAGLPRQTAFLHPAYPNPFKVSTNLRLELLGPDHVELTIADYLGQVVQVVFSGMLERGEHQFEWVNNGESGIYVCLLKTSNGLTTSRLISIK